MEKLRQKWNMRRKISSRWAVALSWAFGVAGGFSSAMIDERSMGPYFWGYYLVHFTIAAIVGLFFVDWKR
jgi:hypothetical protein